MEPSNTIYCDEAGFTGNNLLDDDHGIHFVSAAVNVHPEEARDLVCQVRADFRVQGDELKGRKLVRYERGRAVIRFLLDKCAKNSKLAVYNKKYTLATIFYQWTFDEVFGEYWLLLSETGFNRFVSAALFAGFEAQDPLATSLLMDFQALVREEQGVDRQIFSLDASDFKEISALELIVIFCHIHSGTILANFNSPLLEPSVAKWRLELSSYGLESLLQAWGQHLPSLEVYCDASRALDEQSSTFNRMVGRTDKRYLRIGEREGYMTYNLAHPLRFVDSKEYPGVQIADVLSSALRWVLDNPQETVGRDLLERFEPTAELVVGPDWDYLDLTSRPGFVNSSLLCELAERSCRKRDLVDPCLLRFIGASHSLYPKWHASLSEEVLATSRNIFE
jgi:hypothetical protein